VTSVQAEGQGGFTGVEESSFTKGYRKLSYFWGTLLAIFAAVVCFYSIGQGWNNPPWADTMQMDRGSRAGEAILLVFMLTWIALLEGCQISIVGLQGVDMEKYKHEYPRAYACCKVVHAGPNVERFLVGRQFLLLFNGFLASRVSGVGPNAPTKFNLDGWEWEYNASQIFYSNSVLLMILIVAVAQLPTQLLAEDKMMGFFNLPFFPMYTIVYPCLFVESLGLTHSAYILKDLLCYIGGIDQAEADPKKAMKKDGLYYFKCLLSVSAVTFAGIFLFKGWFSKQTGATHGVGWEKLPGWAAICVSCLFLFIMACAEGLQVSALALQRTPTSEFKNTAPKAYRVLMLLGGSDGVDYHGRNMKAFLVGRQFFVACMMVLLGKVTGYAGAKGVLVTGDDWGMGAGFNEWCLQTGFMGAVFVVNVAQLASQVAASIFPIRLINNTIMWLLLHAMLITEASGFVNACYPIMWFMDWAFGMEEDPLHFEVPANTSQHTPINATETESKAVVTRI